MRSRFSFHSHKKDHKAEFGLAQVFSIIIAIVMIGIALNYAQSSGLTPGPIDYVVTEASYIIFKDDNGATCAKNGTSGRIVDRSANASDVIQNAIDDLGAGTIYFRSGDYEINTEIYLRGELTLIGEPNTRLYTTVSGTEILYSPYSDLDYGANRTALTAIVPGDRVLNVDTTGLNASDCIWIGSDAKYQRTNTYVGEIREIQEIVDSTHLIIKTPILLDGYSLANGASVRYVPMMKNITISGLIIEGTSPYDNTVGIRLRSAYNTIIENTQFINCGYQAISVDSSIITNINDCKIEGSHKQGNGYGVSVINAADRVTVTSTDISYCRHGSSNGGTGYGIPSNVRYIGCSFSNGETERQHPEGIYLSWEGCTFSNLAGIYIECPYTTLSDSVITGITYRPTGYANVYNTSVFGILVGHSYGNASNSKIVNNHITVDCGDASRQIISVLWANDTLISGNNIVSQDRDYASYGIYVNGGNGAFNFYGEGLVLSNNIIDVSGDGIYLHGTTNYPLKAIQILNNYVLSANRAVYSNATGAIINGNVLIGTGSGNVLEINCPNNVVTNNRIVATGNSNAVSVLRFADNLLFSSNHINNSKNYGLYLRGTASDHLTYCMISDNQFGGESGSAIRMDYTDFASVTSSTFYSSAHTYAILLQSNANDTKISNCQYAASISIANQVRMVSEDRTVIEGVGYNGANNPASAGEWYTHGYEGLVVEWTNGTAFFISIYRNASWNYWTATG